MLLDSFAHDLRYAIRAIRNSPGFAIVAIFSLALGIGANTAIFSLIDAVVLKNLPVQHPEELVQVRDGQQTFFTNPIWEQIRDRQDVFGGAFAFGGSRFNLARGGEAHYAQGNFVSGEYFNTLGVRAVLGRTVTAADDRRGCAGGAVLSYDFWQCQYGGSASVLAQQIYLDTHPFPVIGVAQPGFFGMNVGSNIDVYIPICADKILRGEQSALDRRST